MLPKSSALRFLPAELSMAGSRNNESPVRFGLGSAHASEHKVSCGNKLVLILRACIANKTLAQACCTAHGHV